MFQHHEGLMVTEKDFLLKYGWDDFFAQQALRVELPGLERARLQPARIIGEERGLYRVQAWSSGLDFNETSWAIISGKLQFAASERAAFPAVGDWVLLESSSTGQRGTIHFIFQRKSTLHRKQVGSSADRQILSTNVDYVFITTSINDELNHRRIERYLSIARESDIIPVLLLTKADISGAGTSVIVSDIQEKFPGVQVYPISRDHFASADFLQEYLRPGKTVVVIGSSGVGKSTLVNFLIGEEQIKTQEIRDSDGRGRHTTTARSLYVSRFGGLVIDTPGMREMQLSDHADGLKNHFDDIEELASQCKFRDCKHGKEPGCAIQTALKNQTLDSGRWSNFLKLQAEVQAGRIKSDKVAAAKEQRAWKKKKNSSKNEDQE
jgi:ribosome biogenesis GTPase